MAGNVFAGLLRPNRSVLDYTAQLEDIDSSALRRRMGEAELGQMQRKNALEDAAMAQAAQERNAFAALLQQSGGDQGRLTQLLQQSGNPAFFTRAQELQKAELEARAKRATAAKTEGETMDAALGRFAKLAERVQTDQDAEAWVRAQYADPVIGRFVAQLPLEQALAGIPRGNPQALAQWRAENAMGIKAVMEQQRLSAAAADTRANQTLVPGPDGTYVPNRPLIQAKKEIGAASATKLNVNTDNLGLKPKDRFEMEGKLADDYKAVTKLDNLVLSATSKIKTALAQPGAIKDQAAIYSFAKMLDPDGAVREADYAAISNTAGLGDRIMSYIQRMKTGEQLTPTQRQEMLSMMTAFEEVANNRIRAAQADFGQQAQQYNLRPDAVFSGSRTGTKPPAKPGAAPASPTQPSVSNW